jgi:hypothetical protein
LSAIILKEAEGFTLRTHTYPLVLEKDVAAGLPVVSGRGDGRGDVVLRIQLDDHTILVHI